MFRGGQPGGVVGGVVAEAVAVAPSAVPAPPPARAKAAPLNGNDFAALQELGAVADTARGDAAATREIRSEFAETAFWHPHLLTGADGSVSPDGMFP